MSEATLLLLIFVTFVASLTVCVKVFAWMMGRLAGGKVRECHETAEYIIETGRVPPRWLAKSAKSLWWDQRNPDEKLDALISHFEQSSLVADEATRELLLSGLKKARNHWDESSNFQPN